MFKNAINTQKTLSLEEDYLYGPEEFPIKLIPPSKAPLFNLPSSTGIEIDLKAVLQNGPVILNFIKGTWCPYCDLHMKRLRDWQDKLFRKKITILVISNEPIDNIRKWMNNNPVNFIFLSDQGSKVAKTYGVYMENEDFSRPATFVIDMDLSIRLSHTGKRNEAYQAEVMRKVAEVS